jgi:Zn-dependent protease
MPIHDGLRTRTWDVIGSWWLQGLGCLLMLVGQLGLLLALRPVGMSPDVAARLGGLSSDGVEVSIHPTVQVARVSGRYAFAGMALTAVMGFLTALMSAIVHLLKP